MKNKILHYVFLIAAVAFCLGLSASFAFGQQPIQVTKVSGTNAITGDLNVLTGRTFSIGSGGTFNWNASATFTGSASAFRTAIGAGTSSFDGAFASLTGKPTTISGYGITDPIAYTNGSYSNPAWITALAWSKISSTPTTIAGYGITDPIVLTSGTYANPAWITTLAGSKLTGSYTASAQTLASTRILGRKTAATGTVEELLPSDVLDMITTTRGSVLYRGSTGWTFLPPGTSGYVLTSQGTGADPVYSAAGAGSVAWGGITGTLSDQTDLQTALDGKQGLNSKLTALAGMTWGTNTLLYSPTSSTVDRLATANSSVLITSAGGVPSLSTNLPTAVTIGSAYIYRVGGTTISVADGGLGISSGTPGGVLYFAGASSLASSAALAANQIVLGGGAGTAPGTLGSLGTTTTVLHGNAAGAPSYGAVALGAGGDTSGILTGASGGTGNGFFAISGPASTLKTFTFPNASATVLTDNAAVSVAQGGTGQNSYTNGQLLIGNTSGNTLTKATLTGTANQVVVTNSTGSITLSLPQSVATTSTPTFSNNYVGSSALTFNGTSMTLDFNGDGAKTVTVTSGNCTFTTANQAASLLKPLMLIIDNSGNGSATNFTLPAWTFLGTAAPTSLAAGKIGVFILNSTGTSAGSVIANYSANP